MLDADPKVAQQIDFTANFDPAGQTAMTLANNFQNFHEIFVTDFFPVLHLNVLSIKNIFKNLKILVSSIDLTFSTKHF